MFLTPESIRLVSGKATSLTCPAGSRVQTPPEAPNPFLQTQAVFRASGKEHVYGGMLARA